MNATSFFRPGILLLLILAALPAHAEKPNKAPTAKPAAAAQSDDESDPDAKPEESQEPEDVSQVRLAFDPGSHTAPISALGFTADGKRLFTVGQDCTIAAWNTATGERMGVMRLPGYGMEKGQGLKRWDVAAISADGRRVALGGSPVAFDNTEVEKKGNRTLCSLIVVDLPSKRIQSVVKLGKLISVGSLAFSDDGDQLAIGLHEPKQEIALIHGLNETFKTPNREISSNDITLFTHGHRHGAESLAWSPDSQRLLVGGRGSRAVDFSIWNTSAPDKPLLIKKLDVSGMTGAIDWTPDGKAFIRSWSAFLNQPHGFDLYDRDGTIIKKWMYDELKPNCSSKCQPASIHFLNNESILFSSFDRATAMGEAATSVRFNWKTGTSETLYSEAAYSTFPAFGAVSPDRTLGAIAVSMGLEAVIYRLSDGKVVTRCGTQTPYPTQVGWSLAGKPSGFAWAEELRHAKRDTHPEDLRFGFDLSKMEPVVDFVAKDYAVARATSGDWSYKLGGDKPGDLVLKRAGAAAATIRGVKLFRAITFIPRQDQDPLVAGFSCSNLTTHSSLAVHRVDGTMIAQLQFRGTSCKDLAASPDGKYFIAATGTPRLAIYRTDGEKSPLLSFARVNGEWLLWSPDGYYAASPGGEKMIGWAVNNGPNKLVTFYPADKFAKVFHRPDLLTKALELGSMEAALKQSSTRGADIESLLPPEAELKLVQQTGTSVQLHATSKAGVKGKPVVAMRLLLDGKSLPSGQAAMEVAAGKPADATWTIELPEGQHELKLLARGEEGSAISEPLILRGPKKPGSQPTLYRVCIGVNQYDQESLRLRSAKTDAGQVFDELAKDCVGTDNRFGIAKGVLIQDQDATRANVLKTLTDVRKAAKPGDMVIVFFAGHGVKQADEYYLLTREADTGKSLQGASLSGEDLQKALASIECPVLLLLDACHSARSVKALRPATDDLARGLTDETVGVTVLAAAMAHEVAGESAENGYFTAALIKALRAADGVPIDPYEHALYTHHIYSVIFAEVRHATGGKQNPFLNMPWTVPPLIVREVPPH